MKKKVLMIDNYDSFTYNLVHYIEELGSKVIVKRNDEIKIFSEEKFERLIEPKMNKITDVQEIVKRRNFVEQIKKINPDIIFISPGPCTPKEAGISVDLVKVLSGEIPIFGVCLGHQSIAYAFGSKIIKAKSLLHGKTSDIYHNEKGIYKNLPNPFKATRYHSLIVDKKTLPNDFIITSKTQDGTIMGIKHKKLDLEGVQFHPESILTKEGKNLIKNIIKN